MAIILKKCHKKKIIEINENMKKLSIVMGDNQKKEKKQNNEDTQKTGKIEKI